MTDQAKALLPVDCHFCASGTIATTLHAAGLSWAQVECTNDNCSATGPCRDTEDEAVTAWNTLSQSHSLPGDVGKAEWLNLMPREIVARAALNEGCHEKTANDIRSGFHADVKIRAEVAVKLVGFIQEQCLAALTPSALSGDAGEGEPWPGCHADLQQRRVTTLAKVGLMLSVMAGGEAGEVVGYDAAELYAEVLMALAIEDAEDTDIALEVTRDHPDGDILVRAGK